MFRFLFTEVFNLSEEEKELIMKRKFWTWFLATFLITYAVLVMTNIQFELQNFILGALAVISAILLLLDK